MSRKHSRKIQRKYLKHKNPIEEITEIARQHLMIETLETRRRDSLDFHDVAVWCVKSALIAAYEAGQNAAKKENLK